MIGQDFPTHPRSSLSSEIMRHSYVAAVGFAEPSCKAPSRCGQCNSLQSSRRPYSMTAACPFESRNMGPV